mmetsp:Transcript_35461/g.98110  ORF Transcript_35461/g.98110 Transcript_35461/m.98110 type:complete len:338 (-) Transcript_35461:524-1537(-)
MPRGARRGRRQRARRGIGVHFGAVRGRVSSEVGDELWVGDLPVARAVGLPDQLLDLLPVEGVAAQDAAHVVRGERAGVVGVEPVEGGEQQSVGQGYAAVQHRREEVGVPDLGIVVEVEHVENLLGLVVRDTELLLQRLLQFPEDDGAVLVLVHGQEVLPDFRALLVGKAPGHDLHAAAAKPRGPAEPPQGVQNEAIHLDPGALAPPLGDPGVLQGGLRGEPPLGVHMQQGPSEVLGFAGVVLPHTGVHGVLARGDLLQLHHGGAVEWHVPGQQYEDDDPQAPQITLAGVAPCQHLRGGVRQRAQPLPHLHVRLPHLAEAEVDHLQVVAPLRVIEEVL